MNLDVFRCSQLFSDVFSWVVTRVAEVAREHGWHPPKSLDSDENSKPQRYFVAN